MHIVDLNIVFNLFYYVYRRIVLYCLHCIVFFKNLTVTFQMKARPSDKVQEKIKIVQDFGSKLCGRKRQLCGIVQSCDQPNIRTVAA